MRRNTKINTCNAGHFRTFRDPLEVAAEARRAKAWRRAHTAPETALDKAIAAFATEAAELYPVADYREPNKGEFAAVDHPDFPGVTLRACLRYDPDTSFEDLMGDGVDVIEPDGEDSAASPAPWSLRRVKSGGEIASRDTSGTVQPSRYKRNRHKGPVDLDVREIVKGHLDCGPKGLSRHSRWEAAKASGFNAAADYRRQREQWANDTLTAIGVEVAIHGPDGRKIASESSWGIDFDTSAPSRSHLAEVIRDLAREALAGLPGALAKRRTELEALAAQYAALAPAEVAP